MSVVMDDKCIKRIHVNQHNIKRNSKGESLPVVTVKHKGKTLTGNSVKISGPSSVVYSADNPLSCGARVWIETRSSVEVES